MGANFTDLISTTEPSHFQPFHPSVFPFVKIANGQELSISRWNKGAHVQYSCANSSDEGRRQDFCFPV